MKLALLAMVAAVVGADASPSACAPCHRSQTAAFANAGMTRALESGKNSAILRANPKLTAKIGGYSYKIARSGDESIYTVTDGKETIRIPIDWAFARAWPGRRMSSRGTAVGTRAASDTFQLCEGST